MRVISLKYEQPLVVRICSQYTGGIYPPLHVHPIGYSFHEHYDRVRLRERSDTDVNPKWT